MRHEAIFACYPNTMIVRDNDDGTTDVLDENHNPISIDETTVSAKQAELEAAEPMRLLRQARDAKLAETDWWAGSDHTMTQAQTDYRQALRDITDNATSLDDVTWPTKP